MIKCIVIDDEQPARELITLHLANLRGFQLLAAFDNALDGFNFLQKNTVDLVFLDIQMPRISGLELIRSLKVCPKIILTTAYREYAVEAFELDVLDYLIKPVTQERFMKSISKFNYYNPAPAEKPDVANSYHTAYIFLKTGREQERILLNDILYIEGLRDFIKVHTPQKVFIASERISYMEEKLPDSKFARVHKSYIVALDKINSVHAEQVMIGNIAIPVGRVYKNEFQKKMLWSK
ncbi:LytR/AlgR family response regulator transcription factor [Niastella populi]|uniref:DNA-binding response regulator n=1 Tax=Niastella populi TaxID=550983 RepID=A0A1V9FIY5_9BACT|nr:LytTR family DNA-binding domain-containing protein [Niastella populi]OQP58334.1 DNA-binding response regulator [Niastella populi]